MWMWVYVCVYFEREVVFQILKDSSPPSPTHIHRFWGLHTGDTGAISELEYNFNVF